MTDTPTLPSTTDNPWIAVVPVAGDVLRWAATILSYAAACDRVIVTGDSRVASQAEAEFSFEPRVSVTTAGLPAVVSSVCHEARACVIVREPSIVTPDAFTRARQIVDDDIRIATVSFFSNDADYLSVPERNNPLPMLPPGLTEVTATRLLRSEPLLRGSVPIPVAAGPAVAIPTSALMSLGPLSENTPSLEFAIVDFSLRAIRRSMRNVLDPSTLVLRIPGEVTHHSVLRTEATRASLAAAHPFFPTVYDDERVNLHAPVAGAITLARTAMRGLSVLVDATAVGPFEMGTQVQILNLIRALSRHNKVRRVTVGTIGPPPLYAHPFLESPKIKVVASAGSDFQLDERVEILHRPCQPDGHIPWESWRAISDRIVVTIQDLIAYNNGSYFVDPSLWRPYRSGVVQAISSADGIAVVSDDVAQAILSERLPVSSENVRVIWNGVDHDLGPAQPTTPPAALLSQGFVASQFVLVLGANYAHKNRDLAIEAWRRLRDRGLHIRLVMAGVVVPSGSTRNEEARALGVLPEGLRSDLVVLPDVSAEERVWLLNHASLVLYPTSAEGFGLIPFEAAQCGAPTLFVSFGPLSELVANVPVTSADWSPDSLADAAEALLRDPALARAQAEAVRSAASKYTWDSTADQAVQFYRDLLARPAIGRIPQA